MHASTVKLHQREWGPVHTRKEDFISEYVSPLHSKKEKQSTDTNF